LAVLISAIPVIAQTGPLTLEECVAMALKSSPLIEAAKEKLGEFDAAVDEASAARKPSFAAQASYTRVIPTPETSIPVDLDPATYQVISNGYRLGPDRFNVSLTATQPLYDGGRIKNAVKIPQHGRAAAEWQRMSVIREIRRDVTKAYYQALVANKNVAALDSAIALVEEMLQDLSNAVKGGVRNEHERLQAQMQLANQKLTRQQAATNSLMAHNYLAALTGIPAGTRITLVDELRPPESFTAPQLQALQAQAREASTDIKSLLEQIKLIETSMLITGAANRPAVYAAAGYSGSGATDGELKESGKWTNDGTLSLVAQWNIYDFGSADSKKRQSRSQMRQLELTMDNIRVNLDMMVENNAALLQDAFESIEAGKSNIEQTKRSYEILHGIFNEGMLLPSELLNAQSLTLQAEMSYYEALSNFYTAQAELDYLVNVEN